MEPCDVRDTSVASADGPHGAPRDDRALSQPAAVESSTRAGTHKGVVAEGFMPVGVGDYVEIPDGRYGYVWAVSAPGGPSAERVKPAVLVRLEEDDPGAETVPEWFDATACTPICHVHGSRERCSAVEHGRRCTRWAARTVSAILLDERQAAVCEEDGLALPDVMGERRAVCWQHLAAGVMWAEERAVQTGVWIALPDGGSYERPADIEKVSFGEFSEPVPVGRHGL